MLKTFFCAIILSNLASPVVAGECGYLCKSVWWQSAMLSEVHTAVAKSDPKAADPFGITPLHVAAGYGTPEKIAVLLEAGVDLNATSARGTTPLHWAVAYGTLENLVLLLDAGVDLDPKESLGMTPLIFAARIGKAEHILALLAAGADAQLLDADGNTPFDLVVKRGDLYDTDAFLALRDAEAN